MVRSGGLFESEGRCCWTWGEMTRSSPVWYISRSTWQPTPPWKDCNPGKLNRGGGKGWFNVLMGYYIMRGKRSCQNQLIVKCREQESHEWSKEFCAFFLGTHAFWFISVYYYFGRKCLWRFFAWFLCCRLLSACTVTRLAGLSNGKWRISQFLTFSLCMVWVIFFLAPGSNWICSHNLLTLLSKWR